MQALALKNGIKEGTETFHSQAEIRYTRADN